MTPTTPDLSELIRRLEEATDMAARIVQWTEAYPLDIFPEPDFAKAAEVLRREGMTLDAISASNMRHVVKGVEGMARALLHALEATHDQ